MQLRHRWSSNASLVTPKGRDKYTRCTKQAQTGTQKRTLQRHTVHDPLSDAETWKLSLGAYGEPESNTGLLRVVWQIQALVAETVDDWRI